MREQLAMISQDAAIPRILNVTIVTRLAIMQECV